ncbi:MAG TPA: 2-dehydro-3-deoxygalactonokinase [Burkholderiales bacterium]|nr:2-dehydro-3-deoxygalactonokinase [Burkholderiales bacterium]
MKPSMIAIDWGSTSARAYLLDKQGKPFSTRNEPLGIRNVPQNGFDKALNELCGAWLESYADLPLIAAGMIGSRNGWRDVPYVVCPAGVSTLARGVATVETASGRLLHIVPGVKYTAASGLSDLMRGEETQIVGALPADSVGTRLFLLPGTHSKWVMVENREINWFRTFITGELFDVLRAHTLLCKVNNDHADDGVNTSEEVFSDGMELGLNAKFKGGSAMSRLFSVRTRGLIDGYTEAQQQQFLSGLLIGAEIADGHGILEKRGVALRHATLIGDLGLCELYREGLVRRGFTCDIYQLPAAASGLWTIANATSSHLGLAHA